MAAAIVYLDLKGFSALVGVELAAVVDEVFPEIISLIEAEGQRSSNRPWDANTWGDAIIVVYDTAAPAVRLALAIRDLFRSREWQNLGIQTLQPRIVLHVADIRRGTDPLRALAKEGSHAFGKGIVLPARLEPLVTPGGVWATDRAIPHIRDACSDGDLRVSEVFLGTASNLKGVNRQVDYHWLGREGEIPPTPNGSRDVTTPPEEGPAAIPASPATMADSPGAVEVDATAVLVEGDSKFLYDVIQETSYWNLLRMATIRGVNDYVEKFHLYAARHCPDDRTLDSVFDEYHKAVQSLIRLVKGGGQEEPLEAHVLALEIEKGKLVIRQEPTDKRLPDYVPEMYLNLQEDFGAYIEDARGMGVAAYCARAYCHPMCV